MASEHRDERGKYYYGLCLIHAFGVEANPRRGAELIKQAAEEKYTRAYRVLSELYASGTGVEKSFRQSVAWELKFTVYGIGTLFKDLAIGDTQRSLKVPELESVYFDFENLE